MKGCTDGEGWVEQAFLRQDFRRTRAMLMLNGNSDWFTWPLLFMTSPGTGGWTVEAERSGGETESEPLHGAEVQAGCARR